MKQHSLKAKHFFHDSKFRENDFLNEEKYSNENQRFREIDFSHENVKLSIQR